MNVDYRLLLFVLLVFILLWCIWFNPVQLGSGKSEKEDSG